MNDRLHLPLGNGLDDGSLVANGLAPDVDAMGEVAQRPASPRRAQTGGESVAISKLRKRLHRQVGQAIADFQMIEAGDKVMVCLSGGKDSYGLLDILLNLRRRAPVPFDIVAVNLDQKQPGFPAEVLPDYLKRLDIPFHIETQDTYSIVKRLIPEGRTMCSLCSRLRRGILYRVASELGATKIALGHHRDDMVVTLLMNMFFGSRMKGMPPKLVSDDGRHVVIRPLAYVAETDLERWAAHRQFPIIPCTLCGSQDNMQRVQVKAMVREWERQYPGRTDNMLNAMAHVVPSHLMDRRLHPFETLKATGVPDPEGDRAFDEDESCGSMPPAGTSIIPLIQPPREHPKSAGLGSADETRHAEGRGAGPAGG